MIADEEGRGGEKVRQRRRWLLQAAIFAPPAVAKSCKSLNEHQLGSEMKHNDIHTVRRCYMRCCEVFGVVSKRLEAEVEFAVGADCVSTTRSRHHW